MVLLWSMAWAADCPEPLTAASLEARVDAATEAVSNDDVSGFRTQYREFSRAVPCLEGPIDRPQWARLLALDAIVRLADGGDVSGLLARVRAIDPNVELPPFLDEVETVELASGTTPLPGGITLYVDGRKTSTVPVLAGDHVVQREVDGAWESVLTSSVPKTWTRRVVVEVETSDTELLVGLGPGFGVTGQNPDTAGDFLPDANRAAPGAVLAGEVRFGLGSAGLFGRASVPLWIGRLSGGGVRSDPRVELGVSAAAGPVFVEVGALVGFTPILAGDQDRERLDPLPMVGVRWFDESFDAGLRFAFLPDSLRARIAAGWSTAVGENRFRLGLDAGLRRRGFEQELGEEVLGIAQTGADVVLTGGLRFR